MLPDIASAVRLQEVDIRLTELAKEIASLPKHIAEIEKKLETHQRKVEADRAALVRTIPNDSPPSDGAQ